MHRMSSLQLSQEKSEGSGTGRSKATGKLLHSCRNELLISPAARALTEQLSAHMYLRPSPQLKFVVILRHGAGEMKVEGQRFAMSACLVLEVGDTYLPKWLDRYIQGISM